MIETFFILGLIWGFFRKIPLTRIFRRDFNWPALFRTLKRRARSVFRKRFRWPVLLLASILLDFLRAATFMEARAGADAWPTLRITMAVLQYATMLLFLFKNRRKPGMTLIMAGTLLNGLVIVANAGMMPVRNIPSLFGPEQIAKIEAAPHYLLAAGKEPLLFLGDIIPFWIFGWMMISIGDIPIMFGISRLSAYLPRRILRKGSKKVEQPRGIEYTEER